MVYPFLITFIYSLLFNSLYLLSNCFFLILIFLFTSAICLYWFVATKIVVSGNFVAEFRNSGFRYYVYNILELLNIVQNILLSSI